MKYDINNRMTNDWFKDHLAKFLFGIIDKIFNNISINTRYMIGRNNLLKNDSIVKNDQKPRANYPIRLLKK